MVHDMAGKKSSKLDSKANRKLSRSKSNRVFLGVLGGMAEYFDADPVHVRLLWIAIIAVAGLVAGAAAYSLVPTVLTIWVVLYIIAYLVMTEAQESLNVKSRQPVFTAAAPGFLSCRRCISLQQSGICASSIRNNMIPSFHLSLNERISRYYYVP